MEEKKLTGYPSIDKPWMKYYTEEEQHYIIPEIKLVEDMYAHTKGFHDEVALEFMKVTVTYDQLRKNIDLCACALSELGVKTGDTVSVCLPNQPEVIYLFYAINKIGAVANMLDPRVGKPDFFRQLTESHTKFLFSMDTALEHYADVLKEAKLQCIISISVLQSLPSSIRKLAMLKNKNLKANLHVIDFCRLILWKDFIKLGKNKESLKTAAYIKDLPAVICYTGGSTGTPKGAIMTDYNFNAYVAGVLVNGFNYRTGDTIIVVAPPWTMYGISNSVNASLCMGLHLLMVATSDTTLFTAQLMKYRPNHIVAVPTAVRALISNPKTQKNDFSHIKSLSLGAEKLDAPFEMEANKWLSEHGCAVKITKGYGMTELGAGVCFTKGESNIPGTVGIPYVTDTITVFNERDGIFVEGKIGEQGEICVQSPKCMLGYLGSSAGQNDAVIKRHADGSMWVHTGDVGHLDKDGRTFIDGRIKRMYTRGGYKVFPGAIELVILRHPAVKECAVVALRDKEMGDTFKAYLVLRNNANRTGIEQAVHNLCAEHLYSYEIPDFYEVIEELPLTNVGKVDYRALEKQAQEQETSQ